MLNDSTTMDRRPSFGNNQHRQGSNTPDLDVDDHDGLGKAQNLFGSHNLFEVGNGDAHPIHCEEVFNHYDAVSLLDLPRAQIKKKGGPLELSEHLRSKHNLFDSCGTTGSGGTNDNSVLCYTLAGGGGINDNSVLDEVSCTLAGSGGTNDNSVLDESSCTLDDILDYKARLNSPPGTFHGDQLCYDQGGQFGTFPDHSCQEDQFHSFNTENSEVLSDVTMKVRSGSSTPNNFGEDLIALSSFHLHTVDEKCEGSVLSSADSSEALDSTSCTIGDASEAQLAGLYLDQDAQFDFSSSGSSDTSTACSLESFDVECEENQLGTGRASLQLGASAKASPKQSSMGWASGMVGLALKVTSPIGSPTGLRQLSSRMGRAQQKTGAKRDDDLRPNVSRKLTSAFEEGAPSAGEYFESPGHSSGEMHGRDHSRNDSCFSEPYEYERGPIFSPKKIKSDPDLTLLKRCSSHSLSSGGSRQKKNPLALTEEVARDVALLSPVPVESSNILAQEATPEIHFLNPQDLARAAEDAKAKDSSGRFLVTSPPTLMTELLCGQMEDVDSSPLQTARSDCPSELTMDTFNTAETRDYMSLEDLSIEYINSTPPPCQSKHRRTPTPKEIVLDHAMKKMLSPKTQDLLLPEESDVESNCSDMSSDDFTVNTVVSISQQPFEQVQTRLDHAATTLQRTYRGYQVREERKVEAAAATEIQRVARGNWGRRRYAAEMEKVLRVVLAIQKWCRGRNARFAVKAKVTMEKWAAINCQRVYRGHLARRQTWEEKGWMRIRAQQVVNEESALKLQKTYRAFVCRQSIKKEDSALKLQKTYRGFIERQSLKQKHLAEHSAAALIQALGRRKQSMKIAQKRLAAIYAIQSSGRRFVAEQRAKQRAEAGRQCIQKHLADYQKQRTIEERAVVKLQRRARVFTSRQRFMRQRDSAVLIKRNIKQWHEAKLAHQAKELAAMQIQSWWSLHSVRLCSWHQLVRESAAVTLQRRVRVFTSRQTFMHKRKSAVIIQKNIKQWLKLKLANQEAAVVKLQRSFRGSSCRRRLDHQRKSAVLIQSCVRRKQTENAKKKEAAVLKLQKSYRGSSCRRRFDHQRKSALLIQSCVRRKQTENTIKKEAAVVKLQRNYRGSSCRQRLDHQRKSAVLIQSCVRRRQTENTIKKEAAVVKLQRSYRGASCRWRLDHQRKSAALIQSHVRRWQTENTFKQEAAVVKLQRSYRGASCRQMLDHQRKSAALIQSHVRRWQTENTFKQEAAVVKLQRSYRGASCRRMLDHQRKSAILIQSSVRRWQTENTFKQHKSRNVSSGSMESFESCDSEYSETSTADKTQFGSFYCSPLMADGKKAMNPASVTSKAIVKENKKYEDLERENQELRRLFEELQGRKSSMNEEIERVTTLLSAERQEKEEVLEKMQIILEASTGCQQQLRQLNQELAVTRQQCEELERAQQEEHFEAVTQDSDEIETLKELLDKERQGRNEIVADMNRIIAEKTAAIQKMEEEMERTNASLAEERCQKEDILEKMQSILETSAGCQQQIADLNNELEETRWQCQEVERARQQEGISDPTSFLSDELQNLKVLLEDERKEKDKAVVTMNSMVLKHSGEVEALEKRLNDERNQKDFALEEINTQLQAKIDEIEALKKHLDDESQKESDTIEKMNSQLQAKKDEIDATNVLLNEERKERDKNYEKMNTHIQDQTAEMEAIKALLNDERKQKEELLGKLSSQIQDRTGLQQKIDNLNEELFALRHHCQELESNQRAPQLDHFPQQSGNVDKPEDGGNPEMVLRDVTESRDKALEQINFLKDKETSLVKEKQFLNDELEKTKGKLAAALKEIESIKCFSEKPVNHLEETKRLLIEEATRQQEQELKMEEEHRRLFVTRLQNGIKVKKHGRSGKPKERVLRTNADRTLVFYTKIDSNHLKDKTCLSIDQGMQIILGKNTANFKRAKSVSAEKCFSLVKSDANGTRQSLDIEVATDIERRDLVDGFTLLLDQCSERNHSRSLSSKSFESLKTDMI